MESLLLRLIDSIYEAALNPDAWPAFLERFAACVSSTVGTSLQITRASARCGSKGLEKASVLSQVHHDPAWGLAYEQHYHAVNAFAEKRFLLEPGQVLTTSAMLANTELVKTEYYNDFLKPQDCFYGLAGLVLKQGPVSAMLTSFRPKRSGDFEQTDSELLQQLMPHLRQACTIHFKLFEARLFEEACLETLHTLPVGVILIDRDKQMLFCNRAAEAILRGPDGLRLDAKGRCRAARPQESAALQRLIDDATATGMGTGRGAGGTLQLRRSCSDQPLTVMVSPLAGNSLNFSQIPYAVVFVADAERAVEPSADMLSRLYGLTPMEAQLAAALADGASLPGLAEARRVSPHTLRSQLNQILQKTGTHRQAELVKLILTSPAILHRSRDRTPG